MPDFSIILPCFNAETTIVETLQSITAQTFGDWEAICVDDGSTDATVPLIQNAALIDPRIRLVRNQGKGPSSARNTGALDHSSGGLIAFCDADDLWLPTKLAELAKSFAKAEVGGAFGQIGFFQDAPDDANVFSTVPEQDLTIDMLMGENPVCTMSNMTVRRDIFVQSGGFDVSMVHNEDLDWLIRVVGGGARIIGLRSLQTWYRTSVGGLSTNLDAMLAGRARAIASAAAFGVRPSARSHAIHHRYLARRALRLGANRTDALRHSVAGFVHSPVGFLTPLRRGAPTLAGALVATLLPHPLRRYLFS